MIPSPHLVKVTSLVRARIQRERMASILPIPTGLKVTVVSTPALQYPTVDVTIVDAPRDWTTVQTLDPCGNPSRKISPQATSVARQIIDMVHQESNGAYGCCVNSDGTIIQISLR